MELSLIRAFNASDDAQQGRLPATRRSEKGRKATPGTDEVYPTKRQHRSRCRWELLDETLRHEHWGDMYGSVPDAGMHSADNTLPQPIPHRHILQQWSELIPTISVGYTLGTRGSGKALPIHPRSNIWIT